MMSTFDNSSELLPLVDTDGNVIGKATRKECHDGSKPLHPVVHLHVFDECGRLYLQKRPDWKDIQPGKWDTAVGGHIDYGESVEAALEREAREELSLENVSPRHLCSYVFESPVEKELINVFVLYGDVTPRPTDELDSGRFWTIGEILDPPNESLFTPNFYNEFKTYILPIIAHIKDFS